MAIFKKKASKDRDLSVRSPSNSPPVGTAPTMTPMNGSGRDVSGSYGALQSGGPVVNGRRLTSNPLQGQMVRPSPQQAQAGPRPDSASGGFFVPTPMAGLNGRQSRNGNDTPTLDQQPQNAQITPPQIAPASQFPPSNPSYPWSTRQLRLYQPQTSLPSAPQSPFPRYGLAVPAFPSHSGHMLIFGGLVHENVSNDLWSLDVRDCSLQFVKTKGDSPSPRVGHASAIADRIMIVWGGDTRVAADDVQDESLYILDLRTQEWTNLPLPPGPCGRYGHAVCMYETTFYVFGGQNDGTFLDDLWAFDIRQLAQAYGEKHTNEKPQWRQIHPSSAPPPRRTGHTMLGYQNKLYVFGGTDGNFHYHDSWSFDIETGEWTELSCIGYIPTPREGHAAAIVDDVIYIFGGRDVQGSDLGDLAAFRITNRRWYMFQNMGPSPSARSGHALCAAHGKVFVLGGEGSVQAGAIKDDPSVVHVLDTTKIKYPADNQPPRPMPRPRTLSDVTEKGNPVKTGKDVAVSRQSEDSINPSSAYNYNGTSPPTASSEKMPPSNSDDSLRQQTDEKTDSPKTLPRSESQDLQQARTNGMPPQRPRRADDEEYRRAMSPANGPSSPSQSIHQSPKDAGNVGVAPHSPPSANHTIHPNLRNTRSPPPLLRPGESLDRPALPPDAFYFGGKSPTSNGFGSRPGSINGRPGSIVGRPGSVSSVADLLRELKAREAEAEASRRREAAFRVILGKAIQQGYIVDEEVDDLPDGEMFSNNDALRQLAEALVRMKHEKAAIQNELVNQMRLASEKITEAERLQRGAVQEAAYYRAKAAAVESGNSEEIGRIESERVVDLEKQLETIVKDHEDTRRELDRVKENSSRIREAQKVAVNREAETLKRAEDAEEAHSRLLDELEDHRQRSVAAESALREHTEKLISLSSAVQQREAERDHLQSQLEEATARQSEHMDLIGQAQTSIAASGARLLEIENQHGQTLSRVTQLERELSDAKAELESRARESEMATTRLAEVENAFAKSREEADSLRSITTGRLGELLESHRELRADDLRRSRAHQDQLRALEEEKSSLLKMLREAGQRVDVAEAGVSNYRTKTRELELALQGLRVEMRAHSTKVLAAQDEVARYRDLYSAKDAELKERDLAVADSEMKLGLLRRLLQEHGISVNEADLSDVDSPDSRELEARLREKTRSHDNAIREIDELTRRCNEAEGKVESLSRLIERLKDARSPSAMSMRSPTPPGDSDRRAVEAERKLHEAEAHHKEKIAALEGDYQTAVRYVKGTEKMLKRMKDELNKQKAANSTLQAELDTLRGRPAGEAGVRTRDASGRSTPSDSDLTRRFQTLQAQHTSIQTELQASRDVLAAREREVELLRMRVDEAEREIESLRDELAQAQHRINTLLDMGGQGGFHLDDEDDEVEVDQNATEGPLLRNTEASSDDEASMAFDKFTNELKQWERARSPHTSSAGHSPAISQSAQGQSPALLSNPLLHKSSPQMMDHQVGNNYYSSLAHGINKGQNQSLRHDSAHESDEHDQQGHEHDDGHEEEVREEKASHGGIKGHIRNTSQDSGDWVQ